MKLTPQEIKNQIEEHESKIVQLQEQLQKSSHITGFERVEKNEEYYIADNEGEAYKITEYEDDSDEIFFKIANYGSEKRMSLLEKMNRLQRLMYRFSAENSGDEIDWSDSDQEKWHIGYNTPAKEHAIYSCFFIEYTNVIYFISKEVAEQALEQFRPLMEEIIKEEQEVREYYLELNSRKITSSYKFPVGRRFVIDNLVYRITDIGEDDIDVFYDIQTITNTEAEVLDFTESELEQIILRGSFNE